ncbi:osmoprotectant NAGGN system M42 family peptidase [Thalassospira australica]|uniref:osmoprotectant NAGGN system M42 family peptidase n=1 Tax=Thalassospira australica TaxID=1528106 RepID=UPI00384B571D
MSAPHIDRQYLSSVLAKMLAIHSPTGMTDEIVAFVCNELREMGVPFELTRRGAIRADLAGKRKSPDRAVAVHLDTLGAMVKRIKNNGRLEVSAIGHWSSRFAEGARVTVHADHGKTFRGTILTIKASGHTFNTEIDSQPVRWEQLELRIDARVSNGADVIALGINVGDMVAIDTNAEFTESGFVVSRHLDDKAGVASVLSAVRGVEQGNVELPVDCHVLFTIAEEVGLGAPHILYDDIAELVAVDNGTFAPGQNTNEFGVTIAMMDMSGPFDRKLNRHLLDLCEVNGIEHSRDVFKFYRSDVASALEAGYDTRASLICFGLDASHGHERAHVDSFVAVADLLLAYLQSPPIDAI